MTGSVALKINVPLTTSLTSVTVVCAVAPDAVIAVTTSTFVPAATVTGMLKLPSPNAVALKSVVASLLSVATSAMTTLACGAVVPITGIVPVAAVLFPGDVTVSVVAAWVWVTYRAVVDEGFSTTLPAARSAVSRTCAAAPQVSGAAEPSGCPSV